MDKGLDIEKFWGDGAFDTHALFGFLEWVGIEPAYRGKGFGKRLVYRAEEIAFERGLDWVCASAILEDKTQPCFKPEVSSCSAHSECNKKAQIEFIYFPIYPHPPDSVQASQTNDNPRPALGRHSSPKHPISVPLVFLLL